MYSIRLKRSAEKELSFLPDRIHDRIVEVIVRLEQNPRPAGMKKLQGRDEYRIRIGDYRILYEINDTTKIIFIGSVAHRKDVYRD